MSINLEETINICDDKDCCFMRKRVLLKAALPIFKELFAEADPKAFYDIYDTNDFLVYIHQLLKDK